MFIVLPLKLLHNLKNFNGLSGILIISVCLSYCCHFVVIDKREKRKKNSSIIAWKVRMFDTVVTNLRSYG